MNDETGYELASPHLSAKIAKAAKQRLNDLAQRQKLFGEVLGGDTGWRLVLWTVALDGAERPVPVGLIFDAMGVGPGTGLRWLSLLEQDGLVEFENAHGGSLRHVSLTPMACEKLTEYLLG